MKKLFMMMVSLALSILLCNGNVSAKDKEVDAKREFYRPTLMSTLYNKSLSKKSSDYYLGKNKVNGVNETTSTNEIKLSYKKGSNDVYELFETYYKLYNGTYVQTKSVIISNSENQKDEDGMRVSAYKDITEYYYNLDSSKISITTDLIAGNGTMNYNLNRRIVKNYIDNRFIEEKQYIYLKNGKYLEDTIKRLVYRDGYKGKRFLANSSYSTINLKKKEVRQVYREYSDVKSKITYYSDEIYEIKSNRSVLEGPLKYGYSKDYIGKYNKLFLHKKYKRNYTYYQVKYHYNKSWKLSLRDEWRKNSKSQYTSKLRIYYKTNGKKSSAKRRIYKKGKVNKQYNYVYNKNGQLKSRGTRTVVHYANGKAKKAYKSKYSKKGKLLKAKRIKLTKKIAKW